MDIDLSDTIRELEQEMVAAANNLEFEKAALLRDQVKELKRTLEGSKTTKPINYPKPRRQQGVKERGGKPPPVSEPF